LLRKCGGARKTDRRRERTEEKGSGKRKEGILRSYKLRGRPGGQGKAKQSKAKQGKAKQGEARYSKNGRNCDVTEATQAVQPPKNHQLSYSALRYEEPDVRSTPRLVVLSIMPTN
jgi:hypothetical protein